MIRCVCACALAAALIGLAAIQSLPAYGQQQTGAGNPQTDAAKSAQTPPSAAPQGSAAQDVGSQVAAPAPSTVPTPPLPTGGPATATPAQRRYGVTRNPSAPPVSTDVAQPLSLDRAIQIALLRQDMIAIADTQRIVTRQSLVQARAAFFPTITPSYSYSQTRTPVYGTVVTSTGTIITPSAPHTHEVQYETATDGIFAIQNIFDSGIREATVGMSRANVFAAEYAFADTRQGVILAVTQDYYNLLRDAQLIKTQQSAYARQVETLESVVQNVNVGNEARVDVFQSQADLANAKLAVIQAQNQYYLDEASLKNDMGVVTNNQVNVANQTVAAPSIAPDKLGLEHYVQAAYVNRLDVKEALERVYAQGYNVKIAQINAGVTLNASIDEGLQLDPSTGETRLFTVVFSYPLFDAGATRAAVRSNKAQLVAAQRTLDQLEQTVRLAVNQSYANREEAREGVAAAQDAVTAGQANYDAAQARQKEGQGTILDVFNAEAQLVAAQVSYVQAEYNYYIAEAQLLRETGLNDPTYVPRVPHTHAPAPIAASAPAQAPALRSASSQTGSEAAVASRSAQAVRQ